MAYALRESLRLIHEEGLETRGTRHQQNRQAVLSGLKILGVKPHPLAPNQLTTLLCVQLPLFVNDLNLQKSLLHKFHIEVGRGLGPLTRKVWRIGLMGKSSREEDFLLLLSALEQLLTGDYGQMPKGQSMKAANRRMESARHIRLKRFTSQHMKPANAKLITFETISA